MTVRAKALVLYSKRMERLADFYRRLGLVFTVERHGDGPEHYAADLGGGLVLEIYPDMRKGDPTLRLVRSRLILEAGDLGAVSEALRGGGERFDGPRPSALGPTLRAVDPDGGELIVFQRIGA